jgi:hypothetical protein
MLVYNWRCLIYSLPRLHKLRDLWTNFPK